MIFDQIRSLFKREPSHGPLVKKPMWFLDDTQWKKSREQLSEFVQPHLQSLRDRGFAIIPGNISAQQCDAVVADFEDVCRSNPEASKFRDQHGLYDRLGSLHMVSEAARKIGFSPKVVAVLRAAFGRDLVNVGSLYFDKGSQQSIHRDTPAFFTNPLNHYFGVWTALEDVRPDSGPLVYFEKGHTVLPDIELYGHEGVTVKNYNGKIERACLSAGLKLTEHYPKKGDTLIWHPELPHGGAAIANPKLSRKSMVFHYIASGTPIYPPTPFFDSKMPLSNGPNFEAVSFGEFKAYPQGAPQFFQNRYEGNFEEV